MRKKSSFSSIISKVLIAGAVAGGVFVATSTMFEREAPLIEIANDEYWNLQEPLAIHIKDTSGIKNYSVILKTADETLTLSGEQFMQPQPEVKLQLKPSKELFRMKQSAATVIVQATDGSSWNVFSGNSGQKQKKFIIDKKRPQVSVVANSYSISRGGSALVVLGVEDENLESFYIEGANGKRFKPQPFYKEGYYAALVAWPVTEADFKATVVAIDKAKNRSKKSVPFYLIERKYRVSKIKLNEKFLEGKIAELAYAYPETQGVQERIAQFRIINEDVRAKNEKLIHDVTSRIDGTMLESYAIEPFYPLQNGKKVASFGDHRLYYYNDEQVSESYHLGLDLASVKMGKIHTQNPGKVVFSDMNGLYGNLPIIDHGLGLYTLYGHCSNVHVQQGDAVKADAHIANTGMSGYAMGDHLHFGVLVQGVEVRPEEWMDKQWIRLNVTDVMNDAKKIISRRQ